MFKNVNQGDAMQYVPNVGDAVFRPSHRGTDRLCLSLAVRTANLLSGQALQICSDRITFKLCCWRPCSVSMFSHWQAESADGVDGGRMSSASVPLYAMRSAHSQVAFQLAVGLDANHAVLQQRIVVRRKVRPARKQMSRSASDYARSLPFLLCWLTYDVGFSWQPWQLSRRPQDSATCDITAAP